MGNRTISISVGDDDRGPRLPPWPLAAFAFGVLAGVSLALGHVSLLSALITGAVAALVLMACWSGLAVSSIRGGWRHRKRLTPLYTALLLLAVAAAEHAAGVALLTGPAAVAAAAATVWGLLRPDPADVVAARRRSRRHRNVLAAVTVVATAWHTGAALAGITLVTAVTWFFLTGLATAAQCYHYRIRPRVKPQPGEKKVPRDRMRQYRQLLATWPLVAAAAGLHDVEIEMIHDRGKIGYRLELDPGAGNLSKEIKAREPNLASALLAKATITGATCTVEPLGPRYARADVLRSDPHKEPVRWDLKAAEGTGSITDRLNVGLYDDSEPVEIPLHDKDGGRHLQAMGMSGSGKSGLVNQMIAKYVMSRNALAIGIDRKGGQELRHWRDALFWFGISALMAEAILFVVNEIVETRGETASGRVWDPDKDGPDLGVFVDEAAEVLSGSGRPNASCIRSAESIRRRGRSVGVKLHLFTQFGTVDAYGSSQVSKGAHTNVCFRTDKPGDIRYALKNPHNLDASTFEEERPGTCFLEAPGTHRPRRARLKWMDDDDVALVVAQFANLQGALDAPSAAAVRRGIEKFIAARREDAVDPQEVIVYLPPSMADAGDSAPTSDDDDIVDAEVIDETKEEQTMALLKRKKAPAPPAPKAQGPLGAPIKPLEGFPDEFARIADAPEQPRRTYDDALAEIVRQLDAAGAEGIAARDVQAVTGYRRTQTMRQLAAVRNADDRAPEKVGDGPGARWRWPVGETVDA